MGNIVRIPSVDSNLFNDDDKVSLTKGFLTENDDVLFYAYEFIYELEFGDVEEIEQELTDRIETMGRDDCLSFFGGTNLAEWALEVRRDTGDSFRRIAEQAKIKFPILAVVASPTMDHTEYFDRYTEEQYGEIYPLYCKPSNEVIRHFLEVCPTIAFMEIGDGNYYAYLTACGKDMSGEIAYAYLMVDDCVPTNIMSSTLYLDESLDEIIKERLRGLLDNL